MACDLSVLLPATRAPQVAAATIARVLAIHPELKLTPAQFTTFAQLIGLAYLDGRVDAMTEKR
jgi:hypothetical protein